MGVFRLCFVDIQWRGPPLGKQFAIGAPVTSIEAALNIYDVPTAERLETAQAVRCIEDGACSILNKDR